ncbi:sensor domain-containing protein [Streptomyces profundus]|uniref:sensor domain-containing protein n=1 Tax=Streptomyces profundus TaxID=2867410 RepID=UPI001D162730|nr:sensor domain-containing protein [Streptomyces sp. MA3_2.13]UED85175.1 sensor domain-containing protein [Streptomyces sp. MA3_2.13]
MNSTQAGASVGYAVEGRVAGWVLAPWRSLALAALTLAVSVPLLCLAVVSICLIPVGVGLYTTPVLFGWIGALADHRRALATRWSGLSLPARRELPARGEAHAPARTLALLREGASWRQLWWLLTDLTAGCLVALLPAGLIAQGVYGYVLAAGVWEPIHRADGTHWYAFVPVSDQQTANLAALVGTGALVLGMVIGRACLRGHLRTTGAALGTS